MKNLPHLLLALILCLCAFSCFGCKSGDVETDPAVITVRVSELDPPLLRLLGEMEAKGFDVSAYKPLVSQPPETAVPVLRLASLPVDLRQFALVSDSEPDAFLAKNIADALDLLLDN